MNVKVPVQDAWATRVGSLPPTPSSVGEVAGGGGGMAGWVLPGDSEQGRGGSLASKSRELKLRVFPASKFSGLKSRIILASFHSGFYWRVFLAGYFSTFIWRVFIASKSSGF
jgi:hypothetical protein